jgi:hypothetical protein
MITLSNHEVAQVSGALSSGEMATVFAVSGKTLVEGLAAGYYGSGIDYTATLIATAATGFGLYAGFNLYHAISD